MAAVAVITIHSASAGATKNSLVMSQEQKKHQLAKMEQRQTKSCKQQSFSFVMM